MTRVRGRGRDARFNRPHAASPHGSLVPPKLPREPCPRRRTHMPNRPQRRRACRNGRHHRASRGDAPYPTRGSTFFKKKSTRHRRRFSCCLPLSCKTELRRLCSAEVRCAVRRDLPPPHVAMAPLGTGVPALISSPALMSALLAFRYAGACGGGERGDTPFPCSSHHATCPRFPNLPVEDR